MKSGMQFVFIFMLAAAAAASGVEKDRTITKVVKLLQKMLERSKQDGDAERVVYAKFKCFCDGEDAKKSAAIKEASTQIQSLEANIEMTQGNSGELSSDNEALKSDMDSNKESQAAAEKIRKDENKRYSANKADLEKAIGQMNGALRTLSSIGADQTAANVDSDNGQFMSGHKGSLLSLNSEVSQALAAAKAFMTPQQEKTASSFLQAPFTGTYTAQSGQVVGIIKNMRDTFEANLEAANSAEAQSADAHKKLMQNLRSAYQEMKESRQAKDKALGVNDDTLLANRKQLAANTKSKEDNEAALEKLRELYGRKTKGFETRKVLRANEEAAIAECVSILNSDAAFETFGGVDATESGALKPKALKFIQMSVVRRHMDANEIGRKQASKALQAAKSPRISKVLALLQAENPFDSVLEEIDKMIDVIKQEGDSDNKKRSWCISERKYEKANLRSNNKKIQGLNTQIGKLEKLINDPMKGLKAQIEADQEDLADNKAEQTEQTKQRLDGNLQYQAEVKNLVQAETILNKAIKVLKAYYVDLQHKLEAGEAGLIQENHGAPNTWKDNAYAGQKKEGEGAVAMLEFIRDETVKEEMSAHKEEEEAQADFEDSMTQLKKDEKNEQKSLAKLSAALAAAEKELLEAQKKHAEYTADKVAGENYLAEIKPGCDFMMENFKKREANRATETASLKKSQAFIKGTPAYKEFELQTKHESYGQCQEECIGHDQVVGCKACLADVTVKGYCAGHPKTKGC